MSELRERDEARAEFDRLRRVAAAALERAQVGDADEAAMLLEQVVTLDARYVPRLDKRQADGGV